MFRRKHQPPNQPFSHADDCRIVKGRSRRRDPVERGRARSLGPDLPVQSGALPRT
jgi:hypothetical protein